MKNSNNILHDHNYHYIVNLLKNLLLHNINNTNATKF